MKTVTGVDVPRDLVVNHLDKLVNQFFKILPLKESGEKTYGQYIQSLQVELIGCKSLMYALSYDSMYLALIAILQYLIDNDCEVSVVRREVFKSISICKKLQNKYRTGGAE